MGLQLQALLSAHLLAGLLLLPSKDTGLLVHFASFLSPCDLFSKENARLAPYDLKMLCIVGKKKTLHGKLSAKERERMQDLEEDATERHLVWLSNSLSNHQS